MDIVPVMTSMLTDITTRLGTSLGGSVNRTCLMPGAVAWDACDCGLLAITVRRTYLSDTFPVPVTAASPCTSAYVVHEVLVTLARCAPNMSDNGDPPTPTALTAAATVLAADTKVVRQSIVCHLPELEEQGMLVEFLMQNQVPVGPLGGCIAVDSTVLIGLTQ